MPRVGQASVGEVPSVASCRPLSWLRRHIQLGCAGLGAADGTQRCVGSSRRSWLPLPVVCVMQLGLGPRIWSRWEQ
eukprot:3939112-Rhodomonas_salina.1